MRLAIGDLPPYFPSCTLTPAGSPFSLSCLTAIALIFRLLGAISLLAKGSRFRLLRVLQVMIVYRVIQ